MTVIKVVPIPLKVNAVKWTGVNFSELEYLLSGIGTLAVSVEDSSILELTDNTAMHNIHPIWLNAWVVSEVYYLDDPDGFSSINVIDDDRFNFMYAEEV